MFHSTNFTEASESYETIERLMQIATMMHGGAMDDIRDPDKTPEQLSKALDLLVLNFANDAYLNRKGLTREDMPPEGFIDQEHMAIWAILASRTHWFVRWGELAFPRIQMSHSYAAQLMATTVSKTEIPFIEAPWPAFAVEVPEGLLPIAAKDGTMTYITRILINTSFLPSQWTEPWWSLELCGKGIEIHRIGRIEEAFERASATDIKHRKLMKLDDSFRIQAKDIPVGDDYEDFWAGYDRSQEDRVAILAARLVLGACIMMTDKANYKEREVKLGAPLAHARRRNGKEPLSRIYVVGRPINVDFRMAVREFVHGKLRSLSVQSLVAGHHKHQPHGPGGTLRKWIFIKPYWRGPDDAPIVVRPHVAGDGDGG